MIQNNSLQSENGSHHRSRYSRRRVQRISFENHRFKLSYEGGNDKDGFPMRQGVIFNGRVRLLMAKGQKTYRPRRKGERKRKSVRGCIVGHDIRVLALTIEKKGENDIPGLTDTHKPLRLGPKRASNIRKLHGIPAGKNSFALVSQKVVRRKFKTAAGKDRHKAPSIQRLVTPDRLYRKKKLAVSLDNPGHEGFQIPQDDF